MFEDFTGAPIQLLGTCSKTSLAEFQVALEEWCDFDIAQYELGRALGMFPPEQFPRLGLKWVFWSNNEIGNFLAGVLLSLVELGLLERNPIEQQFRWKPVE